MQTLSLIFSTSTIFILFLILFYDRKIKSPYISFPIAAILVYGVPNFIFNITAPSEDLILHFVSSLWGFIFFFVYFFCRIAIKKIIAHATLKNNFGFNLGCLLNDKFSLYFSFILFFLGVFLYLSSNDFSVSKMLLANWGEGRSSAGGASLVFYYVFSLSGFLSLYLFFRFGWKSLIFILPLFLFFSFFIKSRGFIVSNSAPIFVAFIVFFSLTVRRFVIGVAAGAGMFSIYLLARLVRHTGSASEFFISRGGGLSASDGGEFVLIKGYYYFVDRYLMGGAEFGENITILNLVSLPFKFFMEVGTLFPEKPADRYMWDEFTGILGINGSYHPTVVGGAFFEDPLFGFIIYPLMFALIFCVSEVISIRIRLGSGFMFCCMVLVGFVIARGAFYNGIMLLAVSMLSVLAVYFFKNFAKGRKS